MTTFTNRKKVWTINGRFFARPADGVSRYGREVVCALDRLVENGDPAVENLQLEIVAPATPVGAGAPKTIPYRVVKGGHGYLWEQIILPSVARGGILSLCNVGPVARHNQVICVHDANVEISPQSYSWRFRIAYRLVRNILCRRAQTVVTVSNFSRSNLDYYHITNGRDVALAPCGCDHAARWTQEETKFSAGDFLRPYVFALGSRSPHKNFDLLVSLIADLDALGVDLVIAGGTHNRIFSNTAGAAAGARHFGYVTDADLAFLFRNALCFAFPSTTEGFGIPPLEACLLGCPVLAADAGSLPEVLGDGATLLPPHDRKAWLEAIVTLLRSNGARSRAIEKGRERAKLYTWERTARIYANLMSAL